MGKYCTYYLNLEHARAKNMVNVLVLLALRACFEVPHFNREVSGEHDSGVMRYAPASPDFPLSIPLSTGEESSGIEDGGDFIDLSIIEAVLSESIYFHYQNNSLLQGSHNPPFTPPESVTPDRI